MPRVVFLARKLDTGGAERQLVALVLELKARGHDIHLVLFYHGGVFDSEVAQAGIPIHFLGKRHRWDIGGFLFRLIAMLRKLRPDIVYSFLVLPNIFGALACLVASRRSKIVWSIRAAGIEMRHYDWLTRIAYWLEAWLSSVPAVIIANSKAGRAWAEDRGFPAQRMRVVENGIDTARFSFDSAGRVRLRKEWGVSDDELVIGLVARLDPMKDHETFMRAAALLIRKVVKVRFICVGEGPAAYVTALHSKARKLNVTKRLVWFGVRSDIVAVNSAFDVACSSSSFGEGFSNTIAEAMACERPCVVTDVGDSARVVGSSGWVVPPRNPDALASAWFAALHLSPQKRANRGRRARSRVESEFSVKRMADKTEWALGLR